MSEKKEVKIIFSKLNDKWHWDLSCGNYQQSGYGENFNDAEKNAMAYAQGITNHGTIHHVYNGGIEVIPAEGKMKDAMADDIKW